MSVSLIMDSRFDTLKSITNENTEYSTAFMENEKRIRELRNELVHQYGYKTVEDELRF